MFKLIVNWVLILLQREPSAVSQLSSDVIFNSSAHFVFPGAAFTRFQTLRLRKIFPDILADQLISYGSCQFPTLGFVVERFKAIQAFVPEAFYKIKGMLEENEHRTLS